VNRAGAQVLLDSTLPIESHLDRTFCLLQTLSVLKIYLHRRINLVVFEDADTDIQGEPCVFCDLPDVSRGTVCSVALSSAGAAILLYFQQLTLLFCFLLASVILAYSKAEPTGASASSFPRRLLQTWKSTTDLPPRFHYWRASWLRYHPTWHHDFWDDAANRAFVAKHFAWFLPTYDSYEKEICRADAVRYCYLYQFGGVYADMDFEALQSLEPLLTQYDGRADILLGSLRSGLSLWASHAVPNALMISTPRQYFWLAVLKEMAQRRRQANTHTVEELTGPVVLRDVYKERQGISRIHILSPETLYPISWITEQDDRQQALHESESETGLHALTARMKRAHPSSYTATYWTKTWA
jgi:mannosyltransferase OCH1-like enzyme